MPDLFSASTGPWIGLAVASIVWVGISLAFFVVLLLAGDTEDAGNYLTGYLVETRACRWTTSSCSCSCSAPSGSPRPSATGS